MLGVEIEFGNNQTPLETSSYKLTKAKTPARTQGFFQFQMVVRGGVDWGLRMSDPSRHQLVHLVVIPNSD